jgi:radical SAM/Cys-rich protein
MDAAPPAVRALDDALPDFESTLDAHGAGPLRRGRVETLQVNVGKRCNQACHHCHVEAGPRRTETMDGRVAARVIDVLAGNPGVAVLDLTGGAPELNPHFRTLVVGARRLGRRVIDRCNLTILVEPGQEELAAFLAEAGVDVVASLPCYGPENVDRQRGAGVFTKSIAALRRLNALGYGLDGSPLRLDLVYNPVGPTLPPVQAALEREYRTRLAEDQGVVFHRLLTLANMPIGRFADALAHAGQLAAYLSLLVHHVNPATVAGVMCRTLVSVGWDGRLHDCDFNQMLELPLAAGPRDIFAVDDLDTLVDGRIATGPHCFGCTAGAGSSCGGAVV